MPQPAPSVARSALWNHLGKMVEYALVFVTTLIVSRGLGVIANGELASLLGFSSLVLVLSSLGLEVALNTAVPRLMSQGDRGPRIRHLFRSSVGARCVALLLAFLVILPILYPSVVKGRFEGMGPVGFVLLVTFLRGIVALPIIALTAMMRTRVTAFVNIAARTAELGAVLFLLSDGLALEEVLLVYALGSAIQLVAYAFAARDLWTGTTSPMEVKVVFMFGVVYWFNILFSFFVGRYGDVLFLSRLLPVTTEASLYDVSYSLVQIGMILFTAGLGGVTLSVFSTLAAEQSPALKTYYSSLVNFVSLMTVPILVFLAFAAPSIIHVLYGDDFAGAGSVLRVMVAFRIGARLVAGGENSDVMLAHGRVKAVVTLSGVGMVVNIILNILLIPRLGAVGSAIAGGSALVVVNAGWFLNVRSILKQSVPLRVWIMLVVPAGVCALLLEWLVPSAGPVALSAKLVAYAVMTSGAYYLIKPLTSSDGQWLEEHASGVAGLMLRAFARTAS
jgi:O-antigen/teichoic acid export membrane protein